ncbi:hypothetical protein [Caulobacter sp.]|uniref:hypothetical protein n=1 Tax=Caulobacter sp. TaxID=78 RepID=UPI001B10F8BD|nr:hypothetical protein [Caulobacter sp.]MBO9547776.1 hypothetical protein [Caulobacter sp.]
MIALAAMLMAAEAFSAPLNLPKPARVDMRVEYHRENIRSGRTETTDASATYEKTVEPAASGYRVQRRLVEAKIASPPGGGTKLQTAFERATRRSVVYLADKNLNPRTVEDWSGVAAEMRADLLKTADMTQDEAASLGAFADNVARMDAAQATYVVARDDRILTIPVNQALKRGKPLHFVDALPNPFGGMPIKSNGDLALEKTDAARGVDIVRWSQSLDPVEAAKSISQALSTMMGNDAEARALLAQLKFDSSTDCLFEVDTRYGLPVKADCTMRMTTFDPVARQNLFRNERWVITQTLKN